MVAPDSLNQLPIFILAIDGSRAEVDVKIGYPGAKIGYCTVACVLIDLALIDQLDKQRAVEPKKFRETEKASAIDAAFPGSNVVTRRQTSARASFREELYDHFHDVIIDEEEKLPLIDTYEAMLELKPQHQDQRCPYFETDGCEQHLNIPSGTGECPGCKRPVYSTDALRIHERFNDLGSNDEAFGYVMQVWERLLLVHLLRAFEKRGMLDQMSKLAFFLDGPLAIFGPPAWLSAAISTELKRINSIVQIKTSTDLVILGVEKSGAFFTHFEEIDQMDDSGQPGFAPRTYSLIMDEYIKEVIQQTSSKKRYGQDTYFGRKFFYKTQSGARIVASIPFLTNEQDTLDSDDISLYPQFGTTCALLDRLVSSRFPNALMPLVSAHAHAAIPLHLGKKVLKQLAQALMREESD
ncbi:MAG: DNA double-strand break repair nuclease NurA [Candidatus Marinimicrobia bacterium]|nr:DNA double-strand break repair nuclease NurA [Candidatus Neomarinimicrobiota bacterium]